MCQTVQPADALNLACVCFPQPPDCTAAGLSQSSITGTATEGRGENFYLLNGGYQPVISLPSNTWARWRILNSASKGFTVVKIVDSATNKTASDCDLMLLAKDGVYLMQTPRRIDGMLLSAANRAEVLVKCSGQPGTKYYLWAGDSAPFSSRNFNDDEAGAVDHMNRHLYFKQDVLAVIEITDSTNTTAPAASTQTAAAGSSGSNRAGATAEYLLDGQGVLQKPLKERACTPRRPPYAVDLRNASLARNGYNMSTMVNITTGTHRALSALNRATCGVQCQTVYDSKQTGFEWMMRMRSHGIISPTMLTERHIPSTVAVSFASELACHRLNSTRMWRGTPIAQMQACSVL